MANDDPKPTGQRLHGFYIVMTFRRQVVWVIVKNVSS
jgi:hypothetical protein